MGIFDVLSGKENPLDFAVNSTVKGVKAGANLAGKGIKAGMEKAKEAKREAEMEAQMETDTSYNDDDDEAVSAGPKFCPHCGKPLTDYKSKGIQ
jgi:hypothetical protein